MRAASACSGSAEAGRQALALLWIVLGIAVGVGVLCRAAPAAADGDPGSDVLVYQPLFLASDANIPIAQQVQLGDVLHAAARVGFPVRVAIIATPSDLGAVTALWQKPRAYARFLGIELSLTYRGRLLVVMPNGIGFNWPGHPSGAAYQTLSHVAYSGDLANRALVAVRALAAASHIALSGTTASRAPAPAAASASEGTVPRAGNGHSTAILALLVALAAGVIAAGWALRAKGARAALLALPGRALRQIKRRRLRLGLATGPLVIGGLAIVAIVALIALRPAGGSQSDALASNPVLDPGTSLSGMAPDFTLYDQFGRPVSLRSFRGRVVILAFTDAECTTLCPLSTTAMLDAKAMLGPAGTRVQLLGVDANPRATSLEDVFTYSQLHGMLNTWRFLTGPLSELRQVWKRYSISVEINRRLIDHTPAIFIIGPRGHLDKLYLTQQSYAAVPQLGQELATEASHLLPGHPPVNSHLHYSLIPGIGPATRVRLRAAEGGPPIALGPGRARLLVFFASWDEQITGLGAGLEHLAAYQAAAERSHLPPLTAVDEGSVEPPGALARFLGTLPHPLPYPVAVDRNGRVGDGYEVEGLPWLVAVTAAGRIAWYHSVAALGWPSTQRLISQVKAALSRAPAAPSAQTLAGSPPPLAALHQQAARLLGGAANLRARIKALRGYPIVLNVWASWCGPCQAEFGLFAAASLRYGRQVAFLGANDEDSPSDARAFLAQHPVSYPSYAIANGDLTPLASIEGLPTTIYLNRAGKVVFVHTGQYDTQGALDENIQTYALGG
jgi:cytochrome oxidase Cu insertion factor (SCO1/SenC/PrrC family)/thiol-disulfide isomerase/thioredoxin